MFFITITSLGKISHKNNIERFYPTNNVQSHFSQLMPIK